MRLRVRVELLSKGMIVTAESKVQESSLIQKVKVLLIGVGLLLTLPTVYLFAQFFSESQSSIQIAQDEQRGVYVSHPLFQLFFQLNICEQQWQNSCRSEIEKMVSEYELRSNQMKGRWPSEAIAMSDLQQEMQRWLFHKENKTQFQKYVFQFVTHEITSHLERWSDISTLVLDPNLDTYYLMFVLYYSIPKTFDDFSSEGSLVGKVPGQSHMAFGESLGLMNHYLQKVVSGVVYQDENWPWIMTQIRGFQDYLQLLQAQLTKAPDTPLNSMQIKSIAEELQRFVQAHSEILANMLKLREVNLIQKRDQVTVTFAILMVSALILAIFLVQFVVFDTRRSGQIISDQKNALARSMKLATLGEMAAGIGHEIATPLAVIRASSQNLERQLKLVDDNQKQVYKKYADRMMRMMDQVEQIIRSMKNFVHGNQDEPAHQVELHKVIEDSALMSSWRGDREHVQIIIHEYAHDLKVLATESELNQVFVNIMNNGVDAAVGRSVKEVHLKVIPSDKNIIVQITDSGPGIPNEIREKIFDSLFTTKQVGKGTGLGLSISKKIVEEKFGGQILLLPFEPGHGATFEIHLRKAS